MSANPHANGGLLLRDLAMPDFRDYAVVVEQPAVDASAATAVLGEFLRDVITRNPDRFRLFGPDEVASNRLQAVFETTDRVWDAAIVPGDDHLAPARLPAAGHQHPVVGGRPLPAQPALRERHRRRQAAAADLPADGRGDRALHPRAGHLGLGAQRRRASPTSCWPAPATSRRWRRSPPPTLLREHLPELRVRVVNVVDLMRLQPETRASARAVRRASSTRCSPPTSRSSSPTTATRG